MVPNNGIHRINSCKIKLGLSRGPDIHDTFFNKDSNEMIVWYLIDIDPLCDTYEIVYRNIWLRGMK